jgi:cation:H+ antiporter
VFTASLAVTLAAARLFARRLDRLGIRFGFPEALIGLLTALAADGPNISSALYALIRGAHTVGVGVLVGSNAFQLAAMIGLSGLLAGSVIVPREALLLEGLTGLGITMIAAAVLLGWLAPPVGLALGAAVAVPYLVIVIGGSELLTRRQRADHLLGRLARFLDQRPRPQRSGMQPSDPAHHLLALIALDVALILAGSAGMVQAALALGGDWHISSAVLGVLILAPLTSVPNAITAMRLGLEGRGAALVGETLNSNSINLGLGVLVPALFTSLGVLTVTAKLEVAWLAGMTIVCIALLALPRGIRRIEASVVIALYLGFVAIEVLGQI